MEEQIETHTGNTCRRSGPVRESPRDDMIHCNLQLSATMSSQNFPPKYMIPHCSLRVTVMELLSVTSRHCVDVGSGSWFCSGLQRCRDDFGKIDEE